MMEVFMMITRKGWEPYSYLMGRDSRGISFRTWQVGPENSSIFTVSK
jgi:hypothetical protein